MNREFVAEQLRLLEIDSGRFDVLQDKAGITVARVNLGGSTAILKCFEEASSRREISNYGLLADLGIATLRIYGATDAALLMEDMAAGGRYRLADETDMSDASVARKLAEWYRALHTAGFEYVARHGSNMYSEAALFSAENIDKVKRMSDTGRLPVWRLIADNFGKIRRAIESAPMTLTYNDFYYTNMAVARDGSSAIMFDYNLLGKGHVFSDMRNVTWSLSHEAGEAFVSAYGSYNVEMERLIDNAISPIVTLVMAYQRDEFPDWAEDALAHVKGGYAADIETLLERI